MDHPNAPELREFWKTGKYTEDLLKTRNTAVNFAIASNPQTPENILNLLLEIHPDHPDLSDIEDKSKCYISGQAASDTDIRLIMAKTLFEKLRSGDVLENWNLSKYPNILKTLKNDGRIGVREAAGLVMRGGFA